MKHYISRFLKTVALLYLGFPIVYIIGAALAFDIPASGCGRILLTPSFYLVSILAVAVGYGIWQVKRWSWYLLLVTNFLMVYLNAIFVNAYGETHYKLLSFLASVGVIVMLTYRVAREIRVPYFFPKIRWWENNPRYQLSVPTTMIRQNGEQLQGQILDLSMGGCFVRIRHDLKEDEPITLQYTVFGYNVECRGLVVWRTQSTVTHPKGIGVKFLPLPKTQRRAMRQICQRLKKIATLYRKSRWLLNQEEFLKRWEDIEAGKFGKDRARAG